MALFLALINDLDEIKKQPEGTVDRAQKFCEVAKKMGITVKEILWVQGKYDGIALLEAPDPEIVSALMLCMKNYRSQTFRVYDEDDMKQILARMEV